MASLLSCAWLPLRGVSVGSGSCWVSTRTALHVDEPRAAVGETLLALQRARARSFWWLVVRANKPRCGGATSPTSAASAVDDVAGKRFVSISTRAAVLADFFRFSICDGVDVT
ncbi:hypothetical protein ACP70R_038726 [Stipagrostis hirtigluma subsp. patula]